MNNASDLCSSVQHTLAFVPHLACRHGCCKSSCSMKSALYGNAVTVLLHFPRGGQMSGKHQKFLKSAQLLLRVAVGFRKSQMILIHLLYYLFGQFMSCCCCFWLQSSMALSLFIIQTRESCKSMSIIQISTNKISRNLQSVGTSPALCSAFCP